MRGNPLVDTARPAGESCSDASRPNATTNTPATKATIISFALPNARR
jgi:hypothetical protein